ncbi:MAG: hypothetical protein QHJ82_10445 [Verrucomicrobiota bacterium]|nr:hypothetical protein [Verrucomicrobiota bacterium]
MDTSLSPTIARRRLPFAAKLVLSILPCILVIAVTEAVLRLTGCGYPAGFFLRTEHAGQKTLIENTRFAWRFMPKQTARAPLSFQFPEEKPPNHFRIFVFGESAAMGDPEPAFGFSRILDVLLQERYPSLRFEVINTAFPAINSHVIREIARDCATCNADVWIVYAGNNEVIGPFGATPAFGSSAPPSQVVRVESFLSRFRIGQWLGGFARELRTRRPANSTEMTELLLSRPVVDTDPVLQRIYANFENNLHAIVRLGLHARARIILTTMVSNLKDCAPFIEGEPPPLPPEKLAVWQTCFDEGTRSLEEGNTQIALARFKQASTLAAKHAGLQFRLGRASLATGDTNAAMRHHQAARDMDAFRARADSRINGIIKRVSQRYPHERVILMDAEQAFNTSSPCGITGAEFMCDHVHFRFSGNYLLARLQAAAVSRFIPPNAQSKAEWLDEEACARKLAFTDWNRYRVAVSLRRQLSGNLFRRQFNHRDQEARLQNEIQSLLNANKPDAMPQQLAIYREAAAAMPNDWVLQDQLGNYLLAHADRRGASAAWSNAVQIAPYAFTPRYKLGLLLNQPETANDALTHLLRAERLRPASPEVHAAIGTAYTDIGKPADADRHFKIAIALDPASEHARIAWAESLLNRGLANDARHQLETLLQYNTNSLQAHLRLALFYAGQNQTQNAACHFSEVLRIDPNNETARRYLSSPNTRSNTAITPN